MRLLCPQVRELVLDERRDRKWRFTKRMRREFENKPAGRIWWVNTNTKIKTHVRDKCVDGFERAPGGFRVFEALETEAVLDEVVGELRRLFEEERERPTVPYYDMAPYNHLLVLFTGENPEDRQMSVREVMEVLKARVERTGMVVERLCREICGLLGIKMAVLEREANVGIVRYKPGAGLQTHIDNVVRSGGSAGPVFTMSLGGAGVKLIDMFPVIEHWRRPVRVETPVGSIVMMDGASRLEWSHGIPEGDETERWTIMVKFRRVSDAIVKYSEVLGMEVYESWMHLGGRGQS